MTDSPLALTTSLTGDGVAPVIRCSLRNRTDRVIHVFDSPRLPYLVVEGATLVVLHGVHPPPPDRDFNLIEIPLTRPLPPGDELAFEIALSPLQLRDHYGEEARPFDTAGKQVDVVCRAGYGAAPIDASARPRMAIGSLLAWQTLVSAPPVRVTFPR